MTPKEKAQELFNKMYQVDDIMGNYPMCFDTAKQCALIAVEEAEKSEYNVLTKFGFVTNNYKSDWWQEVKSEIEKL